MQLSHGTLVQDGTSLDGQEYQRGDPVSIVDNGSNEDLTDAVQVLNRRQSRYMFVLLKAVCWVPTHTEQRSGATYLLTLYGPSLDFRYPGVAHPCMGNRGIATLLGSSVYVAHEVILEGNSSRAILNATDRTSMFTVQWDVLSTDIQMQQPALTPSGSSCASSRSPSESGDDVPVMHFYRHQGRRDSAIEIRDPESPIYKSSTRRKASPKPLFNRPSCVATKRDTRVSTEFPKNQQYGSEGTTWSDLGSDDDHCFDADTAFNFDAGCFDTLELCGRELQMASMNAHSDLQVNFVFMPQNDGDNYVSGPPEQQRPDNNVQSPVWTTPGGLQAGHGNSWNHVQMPPQDVQEMRQPQMPAPQRQQQGPPRQEGRSEYYDQYRLMEDASRSHVQAGALGHHPGQLEPSSMHSEQRADFVPSQQLSRSVTSQPVQGFQMHPRYSEQTNRIHAPDATAAPFPMPQEVHIIQINHHEARPQHLPSSSQSPMQDSLPSTSHGQPPRRSPLPDETGSSSARGTPSTARRAKSKPSYTFTPNSMVANFRQSTQSHIFTLERYCEQLQHGGNDDEQLRKAQEILQYVRRITEDSLQTLAFLQPIAGIPFQGTERRLQSLVNQIVGAMQRLLPEASEQTESSQEDMQQLEQKVKNLKEFIEYLEGVHPDAVKRPQAPAESSSVNGDKPLQEANKAPISMAGRIPAATASVSVQATSGDEWDSCRWADGQATPPPDRLSSVAQDRDHSRIFRGRPENRFTASDFYSPGAYSRPSSHMNSPVTSHPTTAEPNSTMVDGFYQQPLPTPIQQTIPLSDFAMQSRPIQPYTPPTSSEMMRPMQQNSSMPSQNYTTQQENPFCLRPPQQNSLYPTSGAEISQAGYAPRSPVGFHPASGPAPPSGYYQDARSSLSDRRTMRQDRPAPYSLNYREQRRRKES